MTYFLLKLAFDTAVHIGEADSAVGSQTSGMLLRADTIFSALCHTALAVYGDDGLEELVDAADRNVLKLSDAMPYHESDFFLPKPKAVSLSNAEMDPVLRKKIKKLAWIPVGKFDSYTKSLHGGVYPLEEEKRDVSFGAISEQTKARVTAGADTVPYSVGVFTFHESCGLYVICACEDLQLWEKIKKLFQLLGISGVGGKTSSGYGRYHLDGEPLNLNNPKDAQERWLFHSLEKKQGPYLLLTSSLPKDDELDTVLEDASFQLVRRGGFAFTEYADTPVKKKTQYFLAAGSVLSKPFAGDLYDVGIDMLHPIYRYSKPLLMGVTL